MIRGRSRLSSITRTIEVIQRNRKSFLVGKLYSASGFLETVLGGRAKLLPTKNALARYAALRVPSCRGLLFINSITIVPTPAITRGRAVVKYLITVTGTVKVRAPGITVVTTARRIVPHRATAIRTTRLTRVISGKRVAKYVTTNPLTLSITVSGRSTSVGNVADSITNSTSYLLFPGVRSNGIFCGIGSGFIPNIERTKVLINTGIPYILSDHTSDVRAGLGSVTITTVSIEWK